MADTLKNKFSVEASANTSEAVSDTVAANEVDTILSISICNTHASNDETFLLPTWTKTINFLKKKNISLKGIFVSKKEMANLEPNKLCPPKFTGLESPSIPVQVQSNLLDPVPLYIT